MYALLPPFSSKPVIGFSSQTLLRPLKQIHQSAGKIVTLKSDQKMPQTFVNSKKVQDAWVLR